MKTAHSIWIQKLLRWFEGRKNQYQFRHNRTPYSAWVAEVFLQQTQIVAAQEKLRTFLLRFPSVEFLAAASEAEVLQAFKGMGYYSRARNMHRASQLVVDAYQSQFPVEYKILRELPGVGHYTAAVVSSIFSHERHLALDGNQKRVLSRIFALDAPAEGNILSEGIEKQLKPLYSQIPSFGDFNEALMQLGQEICAKNPRCSECVLNFYCQAYQTQTVAQYPRVKAPPPQIDIFWTWKIISKKNRFLLIQSDPRARFLRNELMFPFEITSKPPQAKIAFRHTITNHRLYLYFENVSRAYPFSKLDQWYTLDEIEALSHSSLMRKSLDWLKETIVPPFS